MSDFTYLNVHSHFSRAGGPASPEQWFRRARDLGYTSLAIADRSPLAGWPDATTAARSTGVGLIYGVEVDILLPPDGARRGKADPIVQSALLIAHSAEGARNLAHLASTSYAGWPAAETAREWPVLAAHSAGVVLILLGGDERVRPNLSPRRPPNNEQRGPRPLLPLSPRRPTLACLIRGVQATLRWPM